MALKLYLGKRVFKVLSLFVISLILASCGAGRSVSHKETYSTLRGDLLDYSKNYLGKPYLYSGKGPNSFDCSGFTSFVFKKFGYRLNSSSAGQDRQAPTIAQKDELAIGDLVFFEGRIKNGRVGHVGIVSEVFPNSEFKFIHASTTDGVIISSSTEPYYASRYLRGGRIIKENPSSVTRHKQSEVFKAKANTPKSAVISHTKNGRHDITLKEGSNAYLVKTLVQSDPLINPSLENHRSESSRDKQKEDILSSVNSDITFRKEEQVIPQPVKFHTVQPGETLYSISRLYKSSVEEIKAWNPQLGTVLKAGDKIEIH